MWKLSSVLGLFLLCSSIGLVTAQRSGGSAKKWQTLTGNSPLVVARGGFSGMFPDSSFYAYSLAVQTGLQDVHVWCDVQLTKDGVGICSPDVKLDNTSAIDHDYPRRQNSYVVNGVPMSGWFSLDFTLDELANVNLKQRIFSRAPNFDGTPMQILTVEDVFNQIKPPGLWLNIPLSTFYAQHNLSMRSYVLSVSRRVVVNYISSPEIGFLQSIASRTGRTKRVLQFLGPNDVEITTNQTYGSLLGNLTFIKTFANGIMVPKTYIWPVDSSFYLLNYTTLVIDAHKAGLEVFASQFANDAVLPYDYNYDPISEYLNFVDNGAFSVDGVLSDFPITPSETIDCFSHMGRNETVTADILVISSEGASGFYPGCTDLAYKKAVADGAEILDCPVQITSDGIPFCLGSINLRDKTNIGTNTDFSNLTSDNPDLNIKSGIYAYSLTWAQIQSLKPAITNVYTNYSLYRNPKAQNDGNFMQLSDFLAYATNVSSISGVMIGIENAAYLAKNQGLDVTGAVLDALSKSKPPNKKILIASTDSSVLRKFKSSGGNYELAYQVGEDISDVTNSTISDMKNFSTSVIISKRSVFPTDKAFITRVTDVVPKLQAFNLPVYVHLFRNEFPSQPWDFFSDAYVELNTHVSTLGIDGVITEFPSTASKYKRNRCLGYKEVPYYMTPVQPGGLLPLMVPQLLPPAEAPNPVLTEKDVSEPPLPPVGQKPSVGPNNTGMSPEPSKTNGGRKTVAVDTVLGCIFVLLGAFILC